MKYAKYFNFFSTHLDKMFYLCMTVKVHTYLTHYFNNLFTYAHVDLNLR